MSTSAAYVGQSITITGSGFAASATVFVVWNTSYFLNSCPTSSGGAISSGCTFSVPSTPAGTVTVYGSDSVGGGGSANLTVEAALYISPAQGPIAASVLVSGYGFAATVSLAVSWTSPST